MKSLCIVQANFLKSNKHAQHDLNVLVATRAHVIGLNEMRPFAGLLLKGVPGYQVIMPPAGFLRNNPVLLRNDVKLLGTEFHKMCKGVGKSPARGATVVKFEFCGDKRAHIETHANAHIENAGKPRRLPRVGQDIKHVLKLARLIRRLQGQGYRTTVAGDFNWAWTRKAVQWVWSPKRLFARHHLVTQWDDRRAPKRGSLGGRRIDYIAYHPQDLVIKSQRYVAGEHSDHAWPEVTFLVLEK